MLFKEATIALLLILILIFGCGKNLSQVFIHPPVDQRATESLSGTLAIPKPITMPNPDEFSFAIFADVQIQSENKNLLARFRQDVSPKQINFFVVLGDLAEDGTADEINKVKTDLDQVGIPYYVTIGNHDLFQSSPLGGWDTWKTTFGAATYSVTIAGVVRFLLYDTSSGDVGATQFQWLQEQLATKVPFTFVGSHYPVNDGITPSMWRLESVEERYKMMGLLEQAGVYAYVSGHVHGYTAGQIGNVRHFIMGSMFPYALDFGNHGYVLFHYNHGSMTAERVEFPDVP